VPDVRRADGREAGGRRSTVAAVRIQSVAFIVRTTCSHDACKRLCPPPTAASSAGCTPPQPKILEHHFLKTNTTNYDFLDNIGGVDSLLDIVGRGLKSRDAQFGYFRSSHPPDPS
jgi:hypothetical protein